MAFADRTPLHPRAFVLVVLLFVLVSVHATELPAGFVEETLATNLNTATAIAVAPDGRILIAEQTGRLLVWKKGKILDTPALTLHVTDYWERGLIGITLDPDFPHTPHIYLLYVTDKPFVHHVLSRFTLVADAIDPASERVLLEGDDQATLGGFQPAGHQGGPLRFGADGRLYAGLGEQTAGLPSQRTNTLQGKILRLNRDGSIPEDNPFYTSTAGKYRAIWALGVRNPFGIGVQRETGRIFFTDVGDSSFEEVNDLIRGANYGWPRAEGYSSNALFKSPLYAYPPVIGRSICGAAFYPRELPGGGPATYFPEKWRGKFFFADFMNHWVKALDPDAPTNVVTFARGLNGPIAVEVAPDSSLLVLNRGTIWRDPQKFTTNSGSLVRIRYRGGAAPQARSSPPALLSATGVFRSVSALDPGPPFVSFDENAPVWLPGVIAQRWFSLPVDGKVNFSRTGEWTFPPGTIFIQHYDLAHKPAERQTARFETHVIWIGDGPYYRAGAYRWNADGQDATLVEDGEVTTLPGSRLHWFSPGADESLSFETVVTGFILQVNTRQLNREVLDPVTGRLANQLRLFSTRGLLDPPLREEDLATLPRLASFNEDNASPELRVRSYLDANCAVCHRPGGLGRANFDARFDVLLADQRLINTPLASGDLGIPGARVIVPGAVNKSILYQRLKRTDFFRMPPVSVNDIPPPILPVLKEWIESMKQ